MLVYRIEHSALLRDGRPAGPYSEWNLAREISKTCGDPYHDCTYCTHNTCPANYADFIGWKSQGWKYPTPDADGLAIFYEDLCCFPSLDALRAWFKGWLRAAYLTGFVIGVYEVPNDHVRHGQRQSVFNYNTAVRLFDLSPLTRRKD